MVARGPSRTEFVAEILFETPWFLPDVSLRVEITSGTVYPSALATFTAPLQAATAHQPLTGSTAHPKGGAGLAVHVEHWDTPAFDPQTGEELPRDTHSLADFRARSLAEGPRIARFLADEQVSPIPVDATLAVEFTVRVDDALGLGPVPDGQGRQTSGDLEIRYELIGLRIRRRPRFGGAWRLVEERIELRVDHETAAGPVLTGSFGPHEITKFWAEDLRTAAGTATKKLLINASTPYDVVTNDPEVDETTVRDNPAWPCCPDDRDHGRRWRMHRLSFRDEPPGSDVTGVRLFSESASRWRALGATVARPHVLGTLPPGVIVAGAEALLPGTLHRADLEEAAIYCSARVAWFGRLPAELHLVAYDGAQEVGRSLVDAANPSDFRSVTLVADRPFRAFELQLAMAMPSRGAAGISLMPAGGSPDEPFAAAFGGGLYVEADEFAYLGWEEYLRVVRDTARCDADASDFRAAWEARGRLFFLPNAQYEIETTVRLSAGHPSVDTEHAEVREYLYFETKGLPGLNAQQRVGEEVEPSVRSVYSGGHSRVYREEPVAVAFQEDFFIAVPLALRPPGSIDERHQLFRMALTVQPDIAAEAGTTYTTTAQDWIVANRKVVTPDPILTWTPVPADCALTAVPAKSTHPLRQRLGRITRRPNAPCPLADPTDVISPVLIARPQGTPDPQSPGAELWRANSGYRAAVRQHGAPFIDRRGFVAADLTALEFVSDGPSPAAAGWTAQEGELRLAGTGPLRYARFGEDEWNHLRIQLGVRPGAGTAGLALALPAGTGAPTRGLYAVVRPAADGGRELAVSQRLSGGELVSLETAPVPGDEEWLTLTISAFDDRLRVATGEVRLEVARHELREGRLALVGAGTVRFRALQVQGLDIYAFTFTTSRFRSFAQHIHSYDGRLHALAPDAMGPPTTQTVALLWAATRSEVSAAMQPHAPLEARQTLFRRWTEELGLPLVQEVEHLHLSRLTSGTATQGFLLESPEPIDFTEEVKPSLKQQVQVSDGDLVAVRPAVRALLEALWGERPDLSELGVAPVAPPGGPHPPPPGPRSPVRAAIDRLLDRGALAETLAAEEASVATAGSGKVVAATLFAAHLADGAMAVTRTADALHVPLGEHAAGRGPRRLRVGDRVELVEVVSIDADGRVRVKRWAGHAERLGGATLGIRAEEEGTTSLAGPKVVLAESARNLLPGVIVAVDATRGRLVDWLFPRWEWQDVALRMLQDETGLRALLIPVDAAGDARLLRGRRYELHFQIDRARWSTTDPPDADNRYTDGATLTLSA